MNLRDLRYILAVADLGHFGRAAEACNVSQPTLSGQILKLEEELGVAIFERVGRRVLPTPIGQQILAHARRSVSAADDLAAAARASRDPLAGGIRLGAIPTIAPYLSPYLFPAAEARLPRAPLTLVEDLTGRLLPLLANGDLDAAIVATDLDNDRLAAFDLYEEPFLLVMPGDHDLAARDVVTVGQIDTTRLLLLADGHCLRDQALDLCDAPRGGPEVADVRAASLETLMQLTAARYGLTLAPTLALAGARFEGRIVARPIVGARASRLVRLAYRRDMPRKPAIAALAETIRASLRRDWGALPPPIIGGADQV